MPDLHGYPLAARAAAEVIEALGLRAVFLGDYSDRGPSSRETIRVLREAKAENPGWQFLMGNHEAMLLNAIRTGREVMPQENSAYEEYERKLPEEDVQFLLSLRPFYKSRFLTFVHAGVPNPQRPVEKHSIDELLWQRTHKDFGGKAVVGHTIVEEPRETHNCIEVETGLWSSGILSIGLVSDAPGVKRRLRAVIRISCEGDVLDAQTLA